MENQPGQDIDDQENAKLNKTENGNTESIHDTTLSENIQIRDNNYKCDTSTRRDSNDNDSLRSGKSAQNQQRTETYLKSENEQMDLKSNGTDKTIDITESRLPAIDRHENSSLQHSGHPADADATSDFGDEYDMSDEQSDENEPFIATIYTCQSCGWKPHMEKCSVHRPFQTGFSNGVYQYQGIMPSQVHSYQNYNFSGYTAGQRPVYPSVQPRQTVDMRFNPATSQVVAVPSVVVNQTENLNDYIRTIQSLRRRAFCLSIIMIVLVFGVVTLAILMS